MFTDCHKKFQSCQVIYTRSSDSAPSISAILRLMLIEKLLKSSFSALLELNKNNFPSDQCSFLAYFKQCSLNQCSVFVGPKRALSEDLVYIFTVLFFLLSYIVCTKSHPTKVVFWQKDRDCCNKKILENFFVQFLVLYHQPNLTVPVHHTSLDISHTRECQA